MVPLFVCCVFFSLEKKEIDEADWREKGGKTVRPIKKKNSLKNENILARGFVL